MLARSADVHPTTQDCLGCLTPALLAELERAAAEFARAAGARIARAAGRPRAVDFKAPLDRRPHNSNPVTQVDREVESFLRSCVQQRFPGHAIIGEEHGTSAPSAHTAAQPTWVLDPVDGTTNFINGLPLFASSVGVLYRGWPVAGAIWCASTPALRPGVYHARRGAALCLDGEPVARAGAASWRGIAAEPGHAPRLGGTWDTRMLGSATLECALTAAGVLRVVHLAHPALWDAAAAACLLQAAGCSVQVADAQARWHPLERFESGAADECTATLAAWSRPLIAGAPADLQQALAALAVP